jgi:peptide chain release factor 2
MLIDDLRERLKITGEAITLLNTFWHTNKLEEQYLALTSTCQEEHFWQHARQASILKELQALKGNRDKLLELLKAQADLFELINLFLQEEAELIKLAPEINALHHKVTEFKIALLMTELHDAAPCFLSINAGAGGTESQDWANMLLRMYLRFCEREHLNAQIVDLTAGEEAGIKSATLFIKGTNPYGLLRGEHGVHRLVRISPFDANKRRHTSFAGVTVIPEIAETDAIQIDPADLRIDTYRSSGAGGQHVNKTDSAVRITHLPTGIVVQCQNERSQTQNKETAMKILRAKLAQKQQEEREAYLTSSIKKEKAEWGSQIRSYVLHPYKMVKDHRTDHESPQPEKVLDGELLEFIEDYLVSARNSR